jgi:hypothetical protein
LSSFLHEFSSPPAATPNSKEFLTPAHFLFLIIHNLNERMMTQFAYNIVNKILPLKNKVDPKQYE